MKKKLLPFILGCAMIAAMPLAAHAAQRPTVPTVPQGASESENGFANYGATGTLGGTADQPLKTLTFDGSTTQAGSTTILNTRQPQATTSTNYPAHYNNEKGANFDEANPNQNNDGFSDTDQGGTLTPHPRTDLETALPDFTMTIPKNTVLPFGATKWNIGMVEISASDFINPDKVGVIITKENFVKIDPSNSQPVTNPTSAQQISFDVKSAASGSTVMENTDIVSTFNGSGEIQTTDTKILKYYQIGTRGTDFPYTYTGLSHADYDAGKIVNINEGRHIWLTSGDWANKEGGKYKGSVTFIAYIINGALAENNDATTAPYPKTIGDKASPATGKEVKSWYDDTAPQSQP